MDVNLKPIPPGTEYGLQKKMDLIRHVYKNRFSVPVENMFDELIRQASSFYERPVHTLQELKARQNTKARGDIFEEFCAIYLRCVCRYDHVWLLHDVPDVTLALLGMKRRDMGIDIVVHHNGSFYAVQCKFKQRTESVGWKELSTFYALCMRTGPWGKHIVMTNCQFVRYQGRRTSADVSICLSELRALTSDHWASMAMARTDVCTSTPRPCPPHTELSPDELRNRRLTHFTPS